MKVSPFASLSHEGNRLKIKMELPEVDRKDISLEMKKDSFCIAAPRNGIEYSGCFWLDHDIEPERAESRFENGIFTLLVPFRGFEPAQFVRDRYIRSVVVKG